MLQNGDDPIPRFEATELWRQPDWLGPDDTRPHGCPSAPVLGWLTERTVDFAEPVVMRAWGRRGQGPPRARPHPDPYGAGWRNAHAAPTAVVDAWLLETSIRMAAGGRTAGPAHRALHTALALAEFLDTLCPFTQAEPNVRELPAGTSLAARGVDRGDGYGHRGGCRGHHGRFGPRAALR